MAQRKQAKATSPKRSDPNYAQRSYLLPKDLARDVDVLAAVMGNSLGYLIGKLAT